MRSYPLGKNPPPRKSLALASVDKGRNYTRPRHARQPEAHLEGPKEKFRQLAFQSADFYFRWVKTYLQSRL
jgi:hypothetical protein